MKPTQKQHEAGVKRLNEIFGYGGPLSPDAFPGRRERRSSRAKLDREIGRDARRAKWREEYYRRKARKLGAGPGAGVAASADGHPRARRTDGATPAASLADAKSASAPPAPAVPEEPQPLPTAGAQLALDVAA